MLINEYDDEILPHLSLPPPLPHWPVRNAPEAGQQAGRRYAGFFDYCVLLGVRVFFAELWDPFHSKGGGNLCRPEKKCENYAIGCGSMWSSYLQCSCFSGGGSTHGASKSIGVKKEHVKRTSHLLITNWLRAHRIKTDSNDVGLQVMFANRLCTKAPTAPDTSDQQNPLRKSAA